MTEMTQSEANRLSVQALAFVGDALYSLFVREYLANRYPDVKNLHKLSVSEVNCGAQSAAAHELLPMLDEAELAVYKRGRNCNTVSAPKNAGVTEYRRATGVEALFGWLRLTGNTGRAKELFDAIIRDASES